MPIGTINILGFPTTTLTRAELIDTVVSWITARSGSHHLMALNPIKVCRARKEDRLARHILSANMLYPDAFGIAWAMRRFSSHRYEPIPGCDLMLDVMNVASEKHYRVFLFGASETVVSETRALFERHYPGAQIVGHRHGFFRNDLEKSAAAEQIVTSRPDIVFVAMGALVQEDWIERLQAHARDQHIAIPVLMGVGGSFDAVTGHVPRPPQWMLRLHLEWLFRLIQQPIRAPRMLALPHFALLVIGKKYLGLRLDYNDRSTKVGSLRSQISNHTSEAGA